jgi:hypothetical protein
VASKCGSGEGSANILMAGPQSGRGTRQRGERALSQIIRGVGVRVSSGHVQGARSGFRGFSVRSGMGFFLRSAGRRICSCVPKKRDATARLSAVRGCRFCCAPMRSWPRRRSSGAMPAADGHQHQSEYRAGVGGHHRNHHWNSF